MPSLMESEHDLLQALMAIAEAEDEGREVTDSEMLAVRQATLGTLQKRDALAFFLREIEYKSELYEAEIERMKARKSALDNAGRRLKGYIMLVMGQVGVKSLEGQTSKMVLQRNPPSVSLNILPELLPKKYQRVIPERVEANKVELAKDLKDGKEIPGAMLEPGATRLVIR